VGLAAAEAANPRKTLPKATKQVLWRIALFYIISLTILGLIVPSNNPDLSNASTKSTKYSPFVLAMNLAGIKGMPHIFNAVITLSVMSVANSCTYASTRTLLALSERGMAPKWLSYVDRGGRPLTALIVALVFGLLGYINKAPNGGQIFNWLLALSGLANFFTWGSICLAHIRFRAAWKYQGRSTEELPFKAAFGVVGSWIGFALNVLCLIAQFYTALWPLNSEPYNVETFFQSYLAVPVVLLFFFGYKIWNRQLRMLTPISEIDVDNGRRKMDIDLADVIRQEKAEMATWSMPKRVYNWLC
jgi:amino acid transporter